MGELENLVAWLRQFFEKPSQKFEFKIMFFLRCLVLVSFNSILLILNFMQSVKASEYENTNSLNTFGMPGEIDLPSAVSLPDGQFSPSLTFFGGTIRTTLSFQITNKLTGAFRYARIPIINGPFDGYVWDRSFDIHYLANIENRVVPSIAIGVRDFIGTGLYSGEYIVASKSIGERLKISGGLGWGRLAGQNGFNNILGRTDRGYRDVGFGGTVIADKFFSGNNAPFFSLSYKINEKLQIISELSSDLYYHETSNSKGFTRRGDINLGIKYRVDPTLSVIATLIHGDAIGITVNMGINPKNSPHKSGIEPAPMPILRAKYRVQNPKLEQEILSESRRLLELEGIELKTLALSGSKIEVGIVNRRYINISQMIGRVARILSLTSPPKARKFKINIIDFKTNLFVSEVIIDREIFERNELNFDGPENLWESVAINNSDKIFFSEYDKNRERVSWSFYPYLDVMLFDPDEPIRFHIGAELKGRYELSPVTAISGSLKQPIAGTFDDIKRGPKAGLPNVRSDFMYYYRDIGSNVYIDFLTLDQYLKPMPKMYAVVNIGLLELMYAGIRSEILWKNNKRPFGFGLDVAKVKKRDTNGSFNLKNEHYSTFLASMYYDLPNDWIVKVDAGKYLAGDFGSTLSLKRSFNNGWEIGAYATITDVPFSTFGEGSFEKGLTIKAPISWITGRKSRAVHEATIRPITGDGGARLNLNKEKYLYDVINEYSEKNLYDNWKRVFR